MQKTARLAASGPMKNNATSIDEYIDSKRSAFSEREFSALRNHLPALEAKMSLARERGHEQLVRGIELLIALLASQKPVKDPLPKHMAEAGVAMAYLLKGVDIIPDSIPEIGLADDEWIVARVIARNPELAC